MVAWPRLVPLKAVVDLGCATLFWRLTRGVLYRCVAALADGTLMYAARSAWCLAASFVEVSADYRSHRLP